MDYSSYNVTDQLRMTAAKNYFAWQARLVRPVLGERVVEVGCGIGNFTGALLDCEAVVSLDPDASCVTYVRERYPTVTVLVDEPGTESFTALVAFQSDTCVCLNVLEHIADDGAAINAMAAILTPGGKIVLLLPAFPLLYGPIDRHLGHCRRYDRNAVSRLADAAKMTVVQFRYVNFVGFFGWFVNARLLKLTRQSGRQIAFFDRYVVPTMSRWEAAVPPPFGQSIFAVLRK